MRTAQLRVREVIAVVRRRWKLIVIPTVLVAVLSTIGVSRLPKKYESSTTLLVRPDKTLSVTGYDLMYAFEEQLRNFNEIIYSQALLEALADSLGLTSVAKNETDRFAIADGLKGNVGTVRLGSDSFRISYVDTDPVRAQRAAEVLATLFIQTKISLSNRENALTVEFYEKKVQEYREVFDNSVSSLVTAMKQDVDELPVETRSLYSQVDEIRRDILATGTRMKTLREGLDIIKKLPKTLESNPKLLSTEAGVETLFELQKEDVPFIADLRQLISRYDEALRRYTTNYPDVERLKMQIADLLRRLPKLIESVIDRLESQRLELESRLARSVDALKRSSASTKLNSNIQSNYDMNRRLYDEMQLKLEQARLAQEVGSRGANQFIVLDPAYLPTRPVKSVRILIILGVGFGFLLGVLSAIIAELLDTVIRRPRDIEIYQKPIIAILPEEQHLRSKKSRGIAHGGG